MREIKFRAWYKPLNKMVESDSIESINFDVKTLGVYMNIENRGFHKLRLSDFELMQYTGLKDKNGKEIYEGDIIIQKRADKPYSDKAKYQHVLMVVSWHDGLAYRSDESLELNPHAIDNPSWFNQSPKFITTPVEKTKFTNHAWSPFHNCEVIGNIHEHPHLLETPKAIESNE